MRRLVFVPLFACLLLAVDLPEGFDPERWPGRMNSPELNKLRPQLEDAQQRRDLPGLAKTLARAREVLGKYAGVPEVRPVYGKPVDASQPDLKKLDALAHRSFQQLKGHNGWELAAQAEKTGATQPRLRISYRNGMNALRHAEMGGPNAAEYRRYGLMAFDYIASQQATNGALGYPYAPNAKEGLVSAAAKVVAEGEKAGRKMTEGRWVIEDMTDGGLQFDNGEGGAGLLYAYSVSGNRKYLDAARRAADWAITRPLVINWNYNSFSGYLLARLYRVTGERKYLDAARDKFVYGVLPAQMENGRWVDQHNASPQYHALMCRNLVEYWLALKQAKDPAAAEIERKTRLAIDSMAEETIRHGASNVHEGLPLEAFAYGLMNLGGNAAWEKAAAIYANYLGASYVADRIAAAEPRPETLTLYLLYRSGKPSGEVKIRSLSVGK